MHPEITSTRQVEIEDEHPSTKKTTLLKRFEIPIEHLDFSYVKKCTDVREIERILRILRSNEEGDYPDLTAFVEDRLRKLDPCSRVLRVELPILRSESVPKLKDEIKDDLDEWLSSLSNGEQAIFQESDLLKSNTVVSQSSDTDIPIRGNDFMIKERENCISQKPSNPDRIKSWEYDKWDKFDVDKELMKLDVTDAQIKEWEINEKSRFQENTKKEMERLMKNLDKPIASEEATGNSHSSIVMPKLVTETDKNESITRKSVDEPSFIEEIPMSTKSTNYHSVKSVQGNHTGSRGSISSEKIPEQKQRRIKVQIDDIHIGF